LRGARALAISQTFTVHRELERLLAAIREVRQEQAALRPTHANQPSDDATPYVKVYRLPEPSAHAAGGVARGPLREPPTIAAASAVAKGGDEPAAQVLSPQPRLIEAVAKTPHQPTAKELAESIPAAIAPESWAQGRTMIAAAGHSLIVRQTRPVHREIARLLEKLK
jgi:hypothetical protein